MTRASKFPLPSPAPRSRVPLLVALALAWLMTAPAGAQGIELLGVTHAAGSPGPAEDPVAADVADLVELARRTRSAATRWDGSAPLAAARNAHRTNTREQMKQALEHGYNFLEGDVRREINAPGAMEMRHDSIHESGDNLTLRQWLLVGRESGRGLKLDVKEPRFMEEILALVAAASLPQDRLMFNLGSGAMATWGHRIRERFPLAWLAINPPPAEGALPDEQVETMLDQARRFRGPVTFVIRYDRLTDPAIERLRARGPVSVWNSTFEGAPVEDPDALARALRRRGVDGVIDLRPSVGWTGRVAGALDWGLQGLHTGIDRGLGKARSAASTAVGQVTSGARKVGRVAKSVAGKLW